MRFGYRRVHVLLRREGWAINPKRSYRIYKELGMQLRNKTPRRRKEYNEERPHSAIGYKPPIVLMNRSAAIGPP